MMNKQRDSLNEIIRDIESSSLQNIKINTEYETFELKPHPFLTSNLSGWVGALVVRAILYELDIDEYHVLKWRLENKYIQYFILNHYIPGCMPCTYSFSKLFNEVNGLTKIRALFAKGFFLKATLGHGSGRTKSFDKTADFEDILLYPDRQKNYGSNEKWIIQRKLDLKNEFRVHTFSRDIIPGLTFKMMGENEEYFSDAEEFVKGILTRLPKTLLEGTLVGWDIALTNSNKYYVIEANFTGYHPVHAAGFQTSGFVEDNSLGPIICAWINNFIKYHYRISIDEVEDGLLTKFIFLKEFLFYKSIFDSKHLDFIINRSNQAAKIAIIYFGQNTHTLMCRLTSYLQLANFAERYYIVAKDEDLLVARKLFGSNPQVNIYSEYELFTAEQYQLIKHLGYERRKQVSCYHAVRSTHAKNIVIF